MDPLKNYIKPKEHKLFTLYQGGLDSYKAIVSTILFQYHSIGFFIYLGNHMEQLEEENPKAKIYEYKNK